MQDNPPTPSPLIVLEVEDDLDDIDFFQMAVQASDTPARVIVLHNGEEALAYLKKGAQDGGIRPDLILLDLNMPRKNGYEMLEEIKKDSDLKVIPVVIFTTSSSPSDIRKCYDLGASGYLVKPLEFDGLVTLVKATLDFWDCTKPSSRR